jgi:hypothetical protein
MRANRAPLGGRTRRVGAAACAVGLGFAVLVSSPAFAVAPSEPTVTVAPGTEDPAPADPAQTSERDRELALLRGDREAGDMMGWRPSLYTGKWFMPGKEDRRRCILDRESNFNYRANNGTYFGAYQMSRALGVGATWMMQREIREEFGQEGLAIVRALRELTPDKWNRYWQDRAFWTIWRDGEGKFHWGSDVSHCPG